MRGGAYHTDGQGLLCGFPRYLNYLLDYLLDLNRLDYFLLDKKGNLNNLKNLLIDKYDESYHV